MEEKPDVLIVGDVDYMDRLRRAFYGIGTGPIYVVGSPLESKVPTLEAMAEKLKAAYREPPQQRIDRYSPIPSNRTVKYRADRKRRNKQAAKSRRKNRR